MPNAYGKALGPVPQTEPYNNSMVKNNAGGYTFKITPEQQLRRFLVLGTEGGTYYVSERKLTADNIKNVRQIIESLPNALEILREISVQGLAPRVSPTLLTLAIACSSSVRETRKKAFALLPVIVRTNSHMLEFVSYVNELRGWGRLLRESISNWYNSKNIADLDYQLTKYNNRSNWTTRDVLRMAKPVPPSDVHSELYGLVAKSKKYEDLLVDQIDPKLSFFRNSKLAPSQKNRYGFLRETKLTREMVPTEWLTDPTVFQAFIDNNMPMTAMIRSLGPMTSYGVFKDTNYVDKICARLTSETAIKSAKIHPMSILLALTTYKSGRGFRGSLNWSPESKIIDALDTAFYSSWSNVVPTNKRIMLALDVSGSMISPIMNTNLSCRDATAAMAMVTMATDPATACFGFSTTFKPLDLSPRRRLDDNIRTISRLPFSGTDCSLPMREAMNMKATFDAFVVYTDNETWAGAMHPVEALKNYRRKRNPEAKLIVVGMTATDFSIADPNDSGTMDVVGFDASAPAMISDFIRG
jgi:60 kDa SS-A/Ro ribonucleoprotein